MDLVMSPLLGRIASIIVYKKSVQMKNYSKLRMKMQAFSGKGFNILDVCFNKRCLVTKT